MLIKYRFKLWMILVLGCVPLGVPAWGADAVDGFTMEEVVVSATRWETLKQDIAADVTVITKEEIEKLPAVSVAEVLQYVPGVYVEWSGGPGSNANIRIQGSDIRHVAVYQDGVPLNQLANPMTDLSSLSLQSVERIEVYKGAASSAWGSALGGVVNIITREPDAGKTSFSGSLSSGEFGTVKAKAAVDGTVGPLGYLLTLTRNESDGFMDHTDYSQTAFYSKFHGKFGENTKLQAVYSYTEGKTADPVLNYPDFWDDGRMQRTYQQVALETAPADRVRITLEGHHHWFFNKIDDVYEDHREIWNDYVEELYGGNARVSVTSGRHALSAGADADSGKYDWVNYADTFNTGTWALYANDTLSLGRFSLNTGFRYDHDDNFDSELSPSIGAVYRFSRFGALVRAQAARGFSAPPAAWIYDPTYGNPDLSAETAVNYQFGGEMKPLSFLTLAASLFRADVDELINYDYVSEHFRNIDQVRRQGVEVTARASFRNGFFASLSGTWVDVRNGLTGDTLPDIPRKTCNVSAGYSSGWMSHTLAGKFIDHNSSYPETRDRRFVFDYSLKVTPTRLSSFGRPSFFLNVYNLLDADYLYRSVWPQPGRWVEGGVGFSL